MNTICKRIRKDILRISQKSGHGHVPSCFSVVEIIYAVYGTMRRDPENPSWDERDIFILSKGHASLAHFCVLAHFGYFDKERLDTFGSFISDFGCHADRLKVPGIEASTGSLGHGLGIAVGMALALRIKKSPCRVFALIGDGESNEGSIWEAVMVAANLNLFNLTIIYDNNMSQARGLQIPNPADRFRAFGCEVVKVNGHHIPALKRELKRKPRKVKVIVAQTKKGYGCPTLMANHYEWHRKSPDPEELCRLTEELDAQAI